SLLAAACLLALTLFTRPAAAAQEEPVAVVNGTRISRAEFGRDLVELFGPLALDGMIDRKLVAQAAEQRGITVSNEELQSRKKLEFRLRVRQFMRRARIGPSELNQAAEEMNLSMQGLARRLGEGISMDALRSQLLTEKILADQVSVTEEELRQYHHRTRGKRFLAAHIAVKSQQKARRLLSRLRSGNADWTELVASESVDRQSVPYKGRLPIIPSTSRLGQVLGKMQEGELRLHEGEEAWHILRLLKVVQAERSSFENIKNRLRREYLARRVNNMAGAWLARLHERAVVVRNLASDPEERAVLGKDVAAYVNGEPIPVSKLGQALVDRFGSEMLRAYVERRLVLQQAREKQVNVSEEAVNKRLSELSKLLTERQQQDALQQPENVLQQDEFRAGARDAVRATLLAEKLVADGAELSREKLEQGYRECTAESFSIREIVTDSQTAARRLLGRLQKGSNFAILLRTKSTAAAPWLNLGVKRHIRKGHPYFEHLTDKSRGDLLYFQQNGSYHVAEVLTHETSEGKDKPSSEQFRKEQRQLKIQKRAEAWVEKLRASADIEVNL
ncbi:MAG: hypothetical protein V5A84_01820, partial [Planctomycetota bacterium]